MKKYLFILGTFILWSSTGNSQARLTCLAPADAPSNLPENPTNYNGQFVFDYWIESQVMVKSEGDTLELDMDYYVNTNDGSMLFPKGFMTAIKARTFPDVAERGGEFQHAVWMANGQRVTYVVDSVYSESGTFSSPRGKYDLIKRAILVEQDQTRNDAYRQKYLNIQNFMTSLRNLTTSPVRLPARVRARWGDLPGYYGEMTNTGERDEFGNLIDPQSKTAITTFMGGSESVLPIKTNNPLIGFLVGIFKDDARDNCNKLAVYTKYYLDPTNLDNSDFIEVELVDIKPRGLNFDGFDYEKGSPHGSAIPGMSSAAGSDFKTQMQAYENRMLDLEARNDALKRQQKGCPRDDMACYDRYSGLMDDIKTQKDALNCEIACFMGTEEYFKDEGCTCP